jgi:hypothetical protein
MKIDEIIALCIGCIWIVWILFAFISLFCKKKIIIEEQTLKDGTKQYVIKENWFLKLPFLWNIIQGNDWENFCCFECVFPTKEEAFKWLEHEKEVKEKAKQSEDNSKIISKVRVYEEKR